MEREPWMQTCTGILANSLPGKKQYNDPDHAFPLHSDLSVTTIHANGSPPRITPPTPKEAPSPPVTSHKEVVFIDPAAQDDVSTLSSMSKGDLVNMLLQLNRTNRRLFGPHGLAMPREDSPHAGPNATVTPTKGGPGKKGSPVAAAMGE